MNEDATNPVAGADAPAPGVAVDEAGAPVPAGETEPRTAAGEEPGGDPGEDEPEALEEIEHDGRTWRVPKALKGAFLMQADYTRKTQEVAEQRRAVEADQARAQQLDRWVREQAQEIGQVSAIDQQLAQLAKVDWDAWEQQDPLAAQSAWRKFTQLKDARAGLVDSLTRRDAQRQAEAQRQLHARVAEGRAQLAREIPGWSNELAEKLTTFGMTHGLSRDELENVIDPRLVKILHKAWLGEQILQQQRAAARSPEPPPAQPATVIGARRSPTSVSAASPQSDRLSTADWLKRREAELRQASGRR